ncbi:MAG TPA: leucyl/phenylalanyl-tRNA--protein transferase [Sphingobacteriaceae bacterium]
MVYYLDEDRIWFPPPENAELDGLLAIGGDLSAERLQLAYHWGIFPWYSDETPILWYSPHERFVLFPSKVRISKSMKQVMKRPVFRFTYDQAFAEVIAACSVAPRPGQDGTWITADMQSAYNKLHRLGIAHSVEVWHQDQLVGGLYGIVVNKVFCGESMFSKMSNASKAALIWLCQNKDFEMIDCQFHTSHLESMGAGFISRKDYLSILQNPPKPEVP